MFEDGLQEIDMSCTPYTYSVFKRFNLVLPMCMKLRHVARASFVHLPVYAYMYLVQSSSTASSTIAMQLRISGNSYARLLRPRWFLSVVLEEETAEGFIVLLACAEVTALQTVCSFLKLVFCGGRGCRTRTQSSPG